MFEPFSPKKASAALSVRRALALREFAFGVEALGRYVRGQPLRRAHERVFAVHAREAHPSLGACRLFLTDRA